MNVVYTVLFVLCAILIGLAIGAAASYMLKFGIVITVLRWIRDRILWVHKRWEWYLVSLTVVSMGVMVNDVATAKLFYLFGLIGFFMPPFCILPFVVVQFPIAMIIGHSVSFNAYKRLLGWVLYVAMAGLMIGIEPMQGDTISEVMRNRFEAASPWFEVLVWVTLLAPPPFLFWWTVRERKNPQPHEWDFDATPVDKTPNA